MGDIPEPSKPASATPPLKPPQQNSKAPRDSHDDWSGAEEARNHYRAITDYFKWLVYITLIALGVISTVGLFIFGKDMSQIRSDANAAINATKEAANLQIGSIRDIAQRTAVDEAQKRVNRAFETTNLQEMIEKAARQKTGPEIERQVRREVDRAMESLQQDISSLGRLADAASRMRIGMRSGLDDLRDRRKRALTDIERNRIDGFLDSIAADFESWAKAQIKELDSKDALEALDSYGAESIKKGPTLVADLVKFMKINSNLHQVALAFLAFRDATGSRVRMFDVNGIEQWCRDHATSCK